MKKTKSEPNQVLKIAGVALLAFWVIWGMAAFLLVADEQDGKAGLFGDFFGGFNALVSVLGFGAVLYSLQRQHEDANKAEIRHQQVRETQEEAFKQNARISIFDKRVQVYDAVRALLLAGFGNNLDHGKIQKLMLAVAHFRFLFPEDSNLDEYIDQIQTKALSLNYLAEKQSRSEKSGIPIRPLTEQELAAMNELVLWFSEQYRTGVTSFFLPYLSISTFDKQTTSARS